MAGTNARMAHNAIAKWKKQIEDEIEKRCKTYCKALCVSAIMSRKRGAGHDFTGNFINSIIVCLYKNRQPIIAYYAADMVAKAIQVKMTYRPEPYESYFFKRDYSGESGTIYTPKVGTHYGWGEDDARNFFQSYTPSGNNLFDAVVAYPVEYAKFIEETTGIIQTYAYAESTGVRWLQLPQIAGQTSF